MGRVVTPIQLEGVFFGAQGTYQRGTTTEVRPTSSVVVLNLVQQVRGRFIKIGYKKCSMRGLEI